MRWQPSVKVTRVNDLIVYFHTVGGFLLDPTRSAIEVNCFLDSTEMFTPKTFPLYNFIPLTIVVYNLFSQQTAQASRREICLLIAFAAGEEILPATSTDGHLFPTR